MKRKELRRNEIELVASNRDEAINLALKEYPSRVVWHAYVVGEFNRRRQLKIFRIRFEPTEEELARGNCAQRTKYRRR